MQDLYRMRENVNRELQIGGGILLILVIVGIIIYRKRFRSN